MPPRTLTALPVFNEEQHVDSVLNHVRCYAGDVLVVDDGSTDSTLQRLRDRDDIQIVEHETNRGYGAALLSAFQFAAAGDYDAVVTIDCDGQHQPQLIPELAAQLLEHQELDLVSGSRYLKRFEGQSLPPEDRRAINMQVTAWINENLCLNLTDSFCGFKAYRVESLRDLSITEYGYAMPLQLWVQAAAAGWKIAEHAVPLVYLDEDRSFGGTLDDGQERLRYYYDVLNAAVGVHGKPVGCSG